MNKLIEVVLISLIAIAVIFAMVLKSPMIAFAGLLITIGSVVLFSNDATAINAMARGK